MFWLVGGLTSPWIWQQHISENVAFLKPCNSDSVFICFAKINKWSYEQNDAVAQQLCADIFELADQRILRKLAWNFYQVSELMGAQRHKLR